MLRGENPLVPLRVGSLTRALRRHPDANWHLLSIFEVEPMCQTFNGTLKFQYEVHASVMRPTTRSPTSGLYLDRELIGEYERG